MANNIDKKELIQRISTQLEREPSDIETVLDATLDLIYEALKTGEGVSLRNFGVFYIDFRKSGTVFKFNPAQKLRAMFGWSSTYKGEL